VLFGSLRGHLPAIQNVSQFMPVMASIVADVISLFQGGASTLVRAQFDRVRPVFFLCEFTCLLLCFSFFLDCRVGYTLAKSVLNAITK